MSRLPRIMLTVILAPLSLGLLISGCSPTDATVVGREAPGFELPNADGEFVSLSAFKGSPILINFWYTGCPPCRTEIPYLHQVYSEMQGNGLVILAINVGDSSGAVRQFLENNNLTTFINTVLFDSNGA
ncbi:MAG: redoxin domain-containing protein, partial [Dehalococcoidales bacterium]|nr:redoxin domain-containing protein [Dehalococcoidales bacterium]